MITLALDAFFRQENADSRDWGMKALAAARAVGDPPLIAAAAAAVALACSVPRSDRGGGALSGRGGRVGRRHVRRPACRPPRCDGVPHRRGGVPGSVRGVDGTRRARVGARASDGPGRAPADADPGSQHRAAGTGAAPGTRPTCWTARSRARVWPATMQSLAWDLLNRSFVAAVAGDLETAVATAEESFDMARRLGDNFVSTYARLVMVSLGKRPAITSARWSCSFGGRRGTLVDSRRVAWEIPRPPDTPLAHARPSAEAERTSSPTPPSWPPRQVSARLPSGPTAPAPPSRSTPATPNAPPSSRWRQLRLQTRWEHRSRRRCRGRSRAGLSAGSARPIELLPSSSTPSPRSKRAAPHATVSRPSASYASSAATSTAVAREVPLTTGSPR